MGPQSLRSSHHSQVSRGWTAKSRPWHRRHLIADDWKGGPGQVMTSPFYTRLRLFCLLSAWGFLVWAHSCNVGLFTWHEGDHLSWILWLSC